MRETERQRETERVCIVMHYGVFVEAMNAWEPYELGRLVHAYGGRPVGSLLQPPCRLLMPSKTHAIFLDQTHDNESPVEVRTTHALSGENYSCSLR